MRAAQQVADPRGAFAFRWEPPNLFGGRSALALGISRERHLRIFAQKKREGLKTLPYETDAISIRAGV
jgi:hypothetical protein